jgi:uncharacterized protein YndB with AHSA1/START domain
MCLSAPTAGT